MRLLYRTTIDDVVGTAPEEQLTVYEGHGRLTAYVLAPACIRCPAGRALGRWLRLYRRGQRARAPRTGSILLAAGRRNAGGNSACRGADPCGLK